MDDMDRLAEAVLEELQAQLPGEEIVENAEPQSFRIGQRGSIYLSPPAENASIVAQPTGGEPFPSPLDADDVAGAVEEALRTLG